MCCRSPPAYPRTQNVSQASQKIESLQSSTSCPCVPWGPPPSILVRDLNHLNWLFSMWSSWLYSQPFPNDWTLYPISKGETNHLSEKQLQFYSQTFLYHSILQTGEKIYPSLFSNIPSPPHSWTIHWDNYTPLLGLATHPRPRMSTPPFSCPWPQV